MSVEGAGARRESIDSFPSNVGPQGVPACWDAGEVRPPCVALLANPAARADGEVFDSNCNLQELGDEAWGRAHRAWVMRGMLIYQKSEARLC